MYPESWSCRLIGDQNKKTLKDPLSKCSVFPMMAVLLALRACSSPVALAAFDFPRLFLDNPGIWALHAGQGRIEKPLGSEEKRLSVSATVLGIYITLVDNGPFVGQSH